MDIKETDYNIYFQGNYFAFNYKKSKKLFLFLHILVSLILCSALGIFALNIFISQLSFFILLVSIFCLFAGIIQLLKLLDPLTHQTNSILKIKKDIDQITIKRPFFLKK